MSGELPELSEIEDILNFGAIETIENVAAQMLEVIRTLREDITRDPVAVERDWYYERPISDLLSVLDGKGFPDSDD